MQKTKLLCVENILWERYKSVKFSFNTFHEAWKQTSGQQRAPDDRAANDNQTLIKQLNMHPVLYII